MSRRDSFPRGAAKYELVPEQQISVDGTTLYRIRALKDFGNVKAGDLGGFVRSQENLSHHGDCWVSDNAQIRDQALVSDDAQVREHARLNDHVRVSDKARVEGHAQLFDHVRVFNDAIVGGNVLGFDHAQVCDAGLVFDNAVICDDVRVLSFGTVYGDLRISGKTVVDGHEDDRTLSRAPRLGLRAARRGPRARRGPPAPES